MSFQYIVHELDLTDAGLKGMAQSRSKLWRRSLEEAKVAAKDLRLSRANLQTACKSIEALVEKKKAKDHSTAALSTYRYFAEDRLRTVLSKAYEDLLPFEWVCSWSTMKMQQRMFEISSMLSPILSSSRSRIIRKLPVAVLAVIMESITYGEGDEVDWWLQDRNLKSAERKSVRVLESSGEVTPREKGRVTACFEIITDTLEYLSGYLKDKDIFFFESSAVELFEKVFIDPAKEVSKEEEYPYLSESDCQSLIKAVSQLDVVLASELQAYMRVQRAAMRGPRAMEVQALCMAQEEEGERNFSYNLDSLLLDVVCMLSDIIKCIKKKINSSNEEVASDVMKTLAERWDRRPEIHFRKLFMFAMAMMEGIDTESTDMGIIVQGIVGRIAEDGHFKEERQPRTRINPRDRKRIPQNQPRVILVSRSDSDSEDGTARKRHKRENNLKKSSYGNLPTVSADMETERTTTRKRGQKDQGEKSTDSQDIQVERRRMARTNSERFSPQFSTRKEASMSSSKITRDAIEDNHSPCNSRITTQDKTNSPPVSFSKKANSAPDRNSGIRRRAPSVEFNTDNLSGDRFESSPSKTESECGTEHSPKAKRMRTPPRNTSNNSKQIAAGRNTANNSQQVAAGRIRKKTTSGQRKTSSDKRRSDRQKKKTPRYT